MNRLWIMEGPRTWARILNRGLLLVTLLLFPFWSAAAFVQLGLGTQWSGEGDARYLGNRLNLQAGFVLPLEGYISLGAELSSSHQFLEEDSFKTFLLDEIHRSLISGSDSQTPRSQFRSRYHVWELMPRLVLSFYPLYEDGAEQDGSWRAWQFQGLAGLQWTQAHLEYQNQEGDTVGQWGPASPWQATAGLRMLAGPLFLEYRWFFDLESSDELWNLWNSKANHEWVLGLQFGLFDLIGGLGDLLFSQAPSSASQGNEVPGARAPAQPSTPRASDPPQRVEPAPEIQEPEKDLK